MRLLTTVTSCEAKSGENAGGAGTVTVTNQESDVTVVKTEGDPNKIQEGRYTKAVCIIEPAVSEKSKGAESNNSSSSSTMRRRGNGSRRAPPQRMRSRGFFNKSQSMARVYGPSNVVLTGSSSQSVARCTGN